jgi:hypothetical protein
MRLIRKPESQLGQGPSMRLAANDADSLPGWGREACFSIGDPESINAPAVPLISDLSDRTRNVPG